MIYIAYGPGCKGEGVTVAQAIDRCKGDWPDEHPIQRPRFDHFTVVKKEGSKYIYIQEGVYK